MSENLYCQKYRPDIDGLRAISILLVVFYHFFPHLVPGGFIGVDVFFVISGYLITRIIVNDINNSNFKIVYFYVKRIIRIYPALLFVIFINLIVGWFVLLPFEYEKLGKHIIAAIFFISNFLLLSEVNYFDASAISKPLLHIWSLGIEEQFYIIWPVLLLLVFKLKGNGLQILYATTILSLITSVAILDKYPSHAFYLPLTRFWELACGGLIVLIHSNKKINLIFEKLANYNQTRINSNLLPLAGLLLIFFSAFTISSTSKFPGLWVTLPIIGSMLVVFPYGNAQIYTTRLSNKFLTTIGLISFPLYLWHWPLLTYLRLIEGGKTTNLQLIVVMALSFILAYFTYKLIEQPIKKLKVSKRIFATYLVICSLIIAILAQRVYKNDGFPNRIANQQDILKTFEQSPHFPLRNSNCDNLDARLKFFDSCVMSKSVPPDALLVGDSHSHVLYNALAKQLPELSVVNLGKWHCLPFYSNASSANYGCDAFLEQVITFTKNNDSIKTVYLAGFWNYLAAGSFQEQGTNFRIPTNADAANLDQFKASANKLLDALSVQNKKIVLILDPPNLNFDIKSCFNLRPFQLPTKISGSCEFAIENYLSSRKFFLTFTANLTKSYPSILIYDPMSVFCNDLQCSVKRDGKPLYFDGDHLHAHGAELLVKDMLAKMNEVK